MNLISDLFKGMVVLSILALGQHGCTVKEISSKAVDVHKKGLSSYKKYSEKLTGEKSSWLPSQK